MPTLSLGHLLAALSGYRPTGNEPVVQSMEIDSRQAVAGSVFAAFVGEHVDGHRFIGGAFQRGAMAALVEQPVAFPTLDLRDAALIPQWDGQLPICLRVDSTEAALQQIARYWRKQFNVRVIGVTGSVGKTTTKELTATVLKQKYATLKSEKNFNTEIGLPLQLLRMNDTHERAVIEMGMYVIGDIALLASVAEPEVGVITNVGTVHVERAGSQAAIAQGKRELVEALSADGVAILNADDPLVMQMAAHTQARVMTYGESAEADLRATDIEPLGAKGMRFTLCHNGEMIPVTMPLRGRHSVMTALRAAAVGLVEGLSWDEIVRGLQSHQDDLRMVLRQATNGATIVDDSYNASPQSTIAALDLLNELEGRKVAVLGDMLELGSDEAAGHARVGVRALDVVDEIVTVGARARLIGCEMTRLGFSAEKLHSVSNSAEAIPVVQKILNSADTVLIKGSLGANMAIIVKAIVADSN
ncbi:MAG: UDP-N-acetylmuramoyl-tripeptide--D-alanyl-D-alanine ligase [Candidatus Promineifilaceae bacterium]